MTSEHLCFNAQSDITLAGIVLHALPIYPLSGREVQGYLVFSATVILISDLGCVRRAAFPDL